MQSVLERSAKDFDDERGRRLAAHDAGLQQVKNSHIGQMARAHQKLQAQQSEIIKLRSEIDRALQGQQKAV